MSNLWERFDNMVSAEEVVEQQSKFENPEPGEYKVILETIQAGESSDNSPMLKARFRCEDNKCIFFNQKLQNINNPDLTPMFVGIATTFLDGVQGERIPFESMGKLAERIESIQVCGSYKLKVSYNDERDPEHRFPQIKILEKLEDGGVEEENVPF